MLASTFRATSSSTIVVSRLDCTAAAVASTASRPLVTGLGAALVPRRPSDKREDPGPEQGEADANEHGDGPLVARERGCDGLVVQTDLKRSLGPARAGKPQRRVDLDELAEPEL